MKLPGKKMLNAYQGDVASLKYEYNDEGQLVHFKRLVQIFPQVYENGFLQYDGFLEIFRKQNDFDALISFRTDSLEIFVSYDSLGNYDSIQYCENGRIFDINYRKNHHHRTLTLTSSATGAQIETLECDSLKGKFTCIYRNDNQNCLNTIYFGGNNRINRKESVCKSASLENSSWNYREFDVDGYLVYDSLFDEKVNELNFGKIAAEHVKNYVVKNGRIQSKSEITSFYEKKRLSDEYRIVDGGQKKYIQNYQYNDVGLLKKYVLQDWINANAQLMTEYVFEYVFWE